MRLTATFHTVVDAPLRADAGQYMNYALNLRAHGVYSRAPFGAEAPAPDSLRTPGYPLLLMALLGDSPGGTLLRVGLVQALLGIGVVLAVFLLGRAFLPHGVALAAAALAALSPQLVNAGVFVLSEALFAALLAALLLAWNAAARAGTPWRWLLLAGAVLGAAMLTRPTANFLFPFLAGLLFWHWPRAEALRASAWLLAGLLLVYAPWPARNLVQFGNTGDRTLQAGTLHHGMYPDFTYEGDPASYGYPYRADPRSAEIAASTGSVLAEIGRRFAEEPARHLRWYLVGKPLALWGWNDPQGQIPTFPYPVLRSPYLERPLFARSFELMHVLNWPLVALAALFSVAAWTPAFARAASPSATFAARSVATLLAYATAVHIAGAPFARYAVPFRPELYVAACGGAWLVYEWVRRRLAAGDRHAEA